MKVYNIGSLNIDYVYAVEHFVRPGETISSTGLQTFPGGKGLNQSVALARAGAKVLHGAFIGSGGEFLLDTLQDSGADTSRIKKLERPSGHAMIQVDSTGQNSILLFAGTNHALTPEYIESFLSDARENDTLLVQNETNCLDVIFNAARDKNLQLAFNPSPFEESLFKLPLSYVKWWFCNEIEAAALFGEGTPEEIAERFAERYPDSRLILTLGENGSLCVCEGKLYTQPVFEVKAADTTAAGDTFTGYFLACVVRGHSIPEALREASLAAAIAVSRHGASSSVPWARELHDPDILKR